MNTNHHLTHPKYRADIDGLRAIAVMSVVGFHAFPYWVKGGFIGVDIFFVISGYLISTIIFSSLKEDSFSFAEFYSRRINRIFPSLILVLSASLVFGWFALLADEYKQLGKHVASGAGFVANFALWHESGYFNNAAETKPLLHLWSLGIEEQYYIIWPLLLWISWKQRFNLLTIAIFVGIVSFLLNLNKVNSDQVATFYSPQTRFWELLAGSILAYITLYKQHAFAKAKQKLDTWLGVIIYADAPEPNGSTLHDVQSFLGFILIAVGILVVSKEKHFPGWWAVLPTLGTVLIISAGTQAWLNRSILANRVMVWFGLISYPLYLWHWPLLSFAHITESEMPPRKTRIAAVIISILLAWLTYKLIEKPIRFSKRNKTKTITLIVLMVLLGFAGYNIHIRDGYKFRESIKNTETINSYFVGPFWRFTKNDICLNKYPLVGSEKYSWWFCMASKNEDPTLLLLGDSYANHHYAGFSMNNSFKHHSILSIGTCEPGWVEESKLTKEVDTSPCSGYRSLDQLKLINSIIEKGTLKFAILDGLRSKPDEEYVLRLKKRIDLLEKNNIKPIIFIPHLKLAYDIKGCFARPFKKPKKNCEIDLETYNSLMNDFKPLIQYLTKTNPNVAFFNQNELFCNAENCSMISNGMPLFRDKHNHLSEYGSLELSKIFEKWARKKIPQLFEK